MHRMKDDFKLFAQLFDIKLEDVSEECQIELIELRSNKFLKSKLNMDGISLNDYKNYLNESNSFPNLANHAKKIICMFDGTFTFNNYILFRLFQLILISVLSPTKLTKQNVAMKDIVYLIIKDMNNMIIIFTNEKHNYLIHNCIEKIVDKPSYPAEIKQYFRDETEILQTKDASNIYTTLHLLCMKGDAKNLYSSF